MSEPEPTTAALAKLGFSVAGHPLETTDAFLREQPRAAGRLVDELVPVLARTRDEVAAARALVALGTAHLALGEAARARDVLREAGGALRGDPPSAARQALRLAAAETATGDAKAARALLARALPGVLALEDEPLARELARALRDAGEETAAAALDALLGRRAASPALGGRRLEVVARLVHALKSGAAGTAEPLYAILRAILEETGADRGFVLLHGDGGLRFELGLSRGGRVLGAADFELSTTIVDRALEREGCFLVPDVSAVLPIATAESARELGLASALCAPLRVERKRSGATALGSLPSVKGVAGVLYVDARARARFGDEDARFFELLADCAVLALRARSATRGASPAPAPEPRTAPAAAGEPDPRFPELVTRDPQMRSVLRLLERAAPTSANVLIRGESGTGKELVARALHRLGRNPSGPFEALDCGAVPDTMIQAELFGHERSAFTGADEPRAGLVERAHGGTLFLDEIGEMPAAMQSALLRVLQEGEVRRLGGDRVQKVDVRLVAATHRDLRALVERGEFRLDLLYRVAVVEIRLPPLRERKGDLGLLAAHVLGEIARRSGAEPRALDPDALALLEEHGWPGNVRELENVLASASVLGKGAITRADVDQVLGQALPPRAAASGGRFEGTLEEVERRAIEDRLESLDWNQVQAAKSLGMDRSTLHRKILRYGIARRAP